MREFLRNLAAFAALQLAVLAVLSCRFQPVEPMFAVGATLKHQIADRTSGPRLWLVGGSNVGLGIDSPLLHERVGYHPVNLALNAELGLDYMLNEASDLAAPGDVIVVSPEFEHFSSDYTSPAAVVALACGRSDQLHYLSWSQLQTLADRAFVYLHELVRAALRRRREAPPPASFWQAAYNEYGDVVAHHQAPSSYRGEPNDPLLIARDPRYVQSVINRLNRFQRDCAQRKIVVFFSFPPISQSGVERRPGLDALARTIESGLTMPVLAPANETVYPDGMFFDTCYHLTLAGKRDRTALLVEGLDRYLNASSETIARRDGGKN